LPFAFCLTMMIAGEGEGCNLGKGGNARDRSRDVLQIVDITYFTIIALALVILDISSLEISRWQRFLLCHSLSW